MAHLQMNVVIVGVVEAKIDEFVLHSGAVRGADARFGKEVQWSSTPRIRVNRVPAISVRKGR